MGATSIEWTDFSINPMRFGKGHFCQKISPGCAHCYASRLQPRFGNPEFGGTGSAVPAHRLWLDRSKLRDVLNRKKPTRIFWADMTDLFGDWVPDEWLDLCFATMALSPHHTHQVLTKRPERAREYIVSRRRASQAAALEMAARSMGFTLEFEGRRLCDWPLPNVWLGVSVEDQQRADERIPVLIDTPAALRFLSGEPLLGPVDLCGWLMRVTGVPGVRGPVPRVDWVIAGGESHPQRTCARPCNVAWLQSIVAQCRAVAVPCFVKQLGSRPVISLPPTGDMAQDQTRTAGYTIRSSKGGDPAEWPADLRVREWPDQRRHAHATDDR